MRSRECDVAVTSFMYAQYIIYNREKQQMFINLECLIALGFDRLLGRYKQAMAYVFVPGTICKSVAYG